MCCHQHQPSSSSQHHKTQIWILANTLLSSSDIFIFYFLPSICIILLIAGILSSPPSFALFAPLAPSSLKAAGGARALPFSLLHVTRSVFPLDRKDSLWSSREVCVLMVAVVWIWGLQNTVHHGVQALWDISHSARRLAIFACSGEQKYWELG